MKLLDQFEGVCLRRRLARNTIDAYSMWVRHFLTFCAARHGEWRHPAALGSADDRRHGGRGDAERRDRTLVAGMSAAASAAGGSARGSAG